ncbi:MAG: hypothetical protein JW806_04735 [Sedimentisphaerales bacterium]|nr:hypothetical protein [Sedimentisphaerales bacterium]
MITKGILTKTIFLFVCVFVFTACVDASLYNDPAAIPGFTGRTPFDVSQLGSSLRVDVEYAVYAPGTYPGQDLTGGNQYIYAYQVFNSSISNVAVDFFSVGLSDSTDADLIYVDDTYGHSPGSGIEPLFVNIFSQSAGFIFAGEPLNSRKWSDVLIFSSSGPPVMGIGTVSGGGLSDMGALPTVVPEPATITIISSGLLMLISRKRNLEAK